MKPNSPSIEINKKTLYKHDLRMQCIFFTIEKIDSVGNFKALKIMKIC